MSGKGHVHQGLGMPSHLLWGLHFQGFHPQPLLHLLEHLELTTVSLSLSPQLSTEWLLAPGRLREYCNRPQCLSHQKLTGVGNVQKDRLCGGSKVGSSQCSALTSFQGVGAAGLSISTLKQPFFPYHTTQRSWVVTAMHFRETQDKGHQEPLGRPTKTVFVFQNPVSFEDQ